MSARQSRGSEVAVMTRLRELLTYRVTSGQYSVGSRLPSFRELGEEFGVSRTTVHKVIKELQESGYIRVVPATGAFVHAAAPVGRSDRLFHDEVEPEIDNLVRRAHMYGMDREHLFRLFTNRLEEVFNPPQSRIAFVECNRYDTETLTREISTALGLPVTGILLQDVLNDPEGLPNRFESLITTYYHYGELTEVLPDQDKVFPIHHRPSPSSLLQVARVPRTQVVGVLTSNERTLRSVSGTVQAYLGQGVIGAALDDLPGVEEVLRSADVIIDTLGSHARVSRLGVSVPVMTIQFTLDPESVTQLKHRFGPVAVQREEQQQGGAAVDQD